MNRLFKSLMLVAAMLLALPMTVSAQQQAPAIPKDPAVRIGKLSNGLTYYIRQNDYPKGQADFYIAQKVGSILEEENQRGLAHFLEHMCFNGTKNFPGNQIVSWLESKGVKFGQNLNAYTAVDKTVYNISNVPTANVAVQDSCLLILHDWANELLLEPEEIDSERGVIHQEWRRSMSGQMRILEKILPTIYQEGRYGYRLPIGTMEVVDNFPPQALRDYYEKWYRPDLQGIFVVGDIDPDRIEAKIKEMFSDIEMPENAAERVYFPVEDNQGTIYALGRDPEQTNVMAEMMFKFDPIPDEMKGGMDYLMMDYMFSMIQSMFSSRFNEMMTKPDTKFGYASVGIGDFFLAKTKAALELVVLAKDNDIRPALEEAYREVLRAKRGGFTASEYQRAKDEYMSALETRFNNRSNQETDHLVQQYVANFTDNEPMPAIDWLYPAMKQITSMVNVDVINQVLSQLITDDNRVLMVLAPEKDGVPFPTEEELASLLKSVDGETIEAFVDNVKTEPLIASLPKPGKVVKTTIDAKWGTTVWTLSNGAKVIVKPTKFKEDEIRFEAIAPMGFAEVAGISPATVQYFPYAMGSLGIGSYTSSDLEKYLSGKRAGVGMSVGRYSHSLQGSTTPKDLATEMELIYGIMTAPNFDADEFAASKEFYKGLFHNQETNPQFVFQRDVAKALYKSPYRQTISVEAIDNASREETQNLVKSFMANAADFTFVFVGNVDLEQLKPMVEQYIASLPSAPKKRNAYAKKSNPEYGITAGSGMETFTTKMETPQTWCLIISSATMPYTARESMLASFAGQVMSARLIATVREKEGAVYSIGAQGGVSNPVGMNASIQSAFPMKPEMKEKVLGMIKSEFEDMAKNITDEEFNKVKEFMVKDYTEALEKNEEWLNAITTDVYSGVDMLTGMVDTIKALTPADLQQFMNKLNAADNYRVVILDPAE